MKHSSILALLTPLLSKTAAAVSLKEHLQNQDKTKMYGFDFHGGVFLSSSEVASDFCDPNSEVSLSGYYGLDGSEYNTAEDKHYFYWFFEKRSTSLLPNNNGNTETDGPTPLLVWLNGGPGCSSMLGLLTENGPCLVNEAGDGTNVNPYSWNEIGHVLFLDQPAQVGYSYGSANDSNDAMMAEDAYFFLQSFLQSDEGKKYQNSPLYLTGESYAGHYIPAISHRILEGNKNYQENNLLHIPLAGLAIGNPWTDAEEQNKWYAEYAKENNLFTTDEINKMEEGIDRCVDNIQECEASTNIFSDLKCQIGVASCNSINMGPAQAHNISHYDISKPCFGDMCVDLSNVDTFLNLDSTKEALNVPIEQDWIMCSNLVHIMFLKQVSKSAAPLLSKTLQEEVPVLIYAGDLDYICNYLGVKAVALNLDWDHKAEFNAAEDQKWNDNGIVRSSNDLTFLRVFGAGHMVPTDQPEVALDMITQFVNGEAFVTEKQRGYVRRG